MAKKFLTDIQLNTNVLLNAKIQEWASDPTGAGNSTKTPDNATNGGLTPLQGMISSWSGNLYIYQGTSGSGGAWARVGSPFTGGTLTSKLILGGGSASSSTLQIPSQTALTSGWAAGDVWNESGAIKFSTGTTSGAVKTVAFTDSNITGNAATATALATPRAINNQNFDGTGPITIKASTTYTLGLTTQATSGLAFSSGSTWDGGTTGITIGLATTGTAGTYTKVTTNNYGQVTSGQSLSSTDIPQLGNITNGGKIGSTGNNIITTGTDGTLTAATALPNGVTATTQTASDNSTKVATTAYVDTAVSNLASGVNAHDAVQLATTAALGTTGNLVGGTITPTYNNGTSGVGATLTIASSANWTSTAVDGVQLSGVVTAVTPSSPSSGYATYATTTPPAVGQTVIITGANVSGYNVTASVVSVVAGTSFTIANSTTGAATFTSGAFVSRDRILIKNQAAALQNGIYTVTSGGTTANSTSFVFTRATDNDSSPELGQGDLTYVINGSVNGNASFVQTSLGSGTNGAITVGTDSITWSQFSGGAAALAGTGLQVNANGVELELSPVGRSDGSSTSATLVKSVSTNSYGQVTGINTGAHPDADATTKGIASFSSTYFTVASGAVSLSSLGSLNASTATKATTTAVTSNPTTNADMPLLYGTVSSNALTGYVTSDGTNFKYLTYNPSTNILYSTGGFNSQYYFITGTHKLTTWGAFNVGLLLDQAATGTPSILGLQAGTTSGTQAGGNAFMYAGNSTGGGNGGNIIIKAGTGAANGTITIGNTETSAVTIGSSNTSTTVYGTAITLNTGSGIIQGTSAGSGAGASSGIVLASGVHTGGGNPGTSGNVYIDVGYASGSSSTFGSINIGTLTNAANGGVTSSTATLTSGVNTFNKPSAINIGQSSVTTTVNGTLKVSGLTTNGLLRTNSGDGTIAVAASSDYVASVSAGTGVSVNQTTGAVSVSIPQSVATSATPQFAGLGLGTGAPSAGLTVSGGKITAAAGVASYASLLVSPGSADPTSPAAGDVWNNAGVLKFRDSSSNTKTIAFTDSAMTGTVNGTTIPSSATLAKKYSFATTATYTAGANTLTITGATHGMGNPNLIVQFYDTTSTAGSLVQIEVDVTINTTTYDVTIGWTQIGSASAGAYRVVITG